MVSRIRGLTGLLEACPQSPILPTARGAIAPAPADVQPRFFVSPRLDRFRGSARGPRAGAVSGARGPELIPGLDARAAPPAGDARAGPGRRPRQAARRAAGPGGG